MKAGLRLARKDLALVLSGGQGLSQAVLLGLLLIFVFSLSRPPGEVVEAQAAAAIFWLASSFGLVLVFNTLYGLEEAEGARHGLLLSPVPAQAVWLGKSLAGGLLLLLSQLMFAPAAVIFLDQDLPGLPWVAVTALVLVDWGLAALGSLLGALSQGQGARESLLSVILFPLLVPLLLAGIRLLTLSLTGEGGADMQAWYGLALAFDLVFTAAALVLFGFVFTAEE